MKKSDLVIDGIYSDTIGTLRYKLYLSAAALPRAPLFVMLHGATQSASDFAIGTRMHEVIHECGGIALFPQQSRGAHPMGCWNWYDSRHQVAEEGEPAMLAGLTRKIIDEHNVDRRRVYVAGMSAGGAMAVILGQTYPGIFAAVGVHSGMPAGVASNISSAMRIMNSGPGALVDLEDKPIVLGLPIPTIVFHGDRDLTVHPHNAAAVLEQALSGKIGRAELEPGLKPRRTDGDRDVTLVKHSRHGRRPDAELWIVHGHGHAWAGGSSRGSYADDSGPDASREMRRFFLKQSLAAGQQSEAA